MLRWQWFKALSVVAICAVHAFRILRPFSSFRGCTDLHAVTSNIFIVGKRSVSEGWIGAGCAEYEKRLSPILHIQTTFVKSNEDLVKAVRGCKGVVFALDETGRSLSSSEFADEFFSSLQQGSSHVDFVIGGHDGLPPQLKSGLPLISLSRLTWPHQLARLLLIEQIYRAFEIRKGSAYHR